MFIPDPDLDFLPIQDPGIKKEPYSRSGFATLVMKNTLCASHFPSLCLILSPLSVAGRGVFSLSLKK